MKLLTVILAITFMVIIFTQAVLFYKSTVCRQKIWQTGFVSITRGLLDNQKVTEQSWLSECSVNIIRSGAMAGSGRTKISLALKGKL